MLKVENVEVWGFPHAIRGMRNPMNSWGRSDSIKCSENMECSGICDNHKCGFCIGKNDLDLMRRLYKAGTEHRKYLRQIFVSMDIVAPLYWWKEFDTYKVGTVANSCSTMHKIAAKEFTLDDFSHEHLTSEGGLSFLRNTVSGLNVYRLRYLESKDKKWWWQIIQLLPSSYNQRRTVTMNYENVMSIINQRKNHKLDEWHQFVAVLEELPYVKAIRGEEYEKQEEAKEQNAKGRRSFYVSIEET